MAERIGHVNAVVIAGFAASANLFIMANLDSFFDLLAAETFNALSLALFNGAYEVCLKNAAKAENRSAKLSQLLGHFSQWQFLSIALASLVGGFVFDKTTGGTAFRLVACAMAIMSLIYIFLAAKTSQLSTSKVMTKTNFRKYMSDAAAAAWKGRRTVVIYSFVAGLYETLMVIWPVLLTRDIKGEFNVSGLSVFFVFLMFCHSFAGWLSRKLHEMTLFGALSGVLLLQWVIRVFALPLSVTLYVFIGGAVVFYKSSLIVMTSHLIELGDDQNQVFTYSFNTTISRIIISPILIGVADILPRLPSDQIVLGGGVISVLTLAFMIVTARLEARKAERR